MHLSKNMLTYPRSLPSSLLLRRTHRTMPHAAEAAGSRSFAPSASASFARASSSASRAVTFALAVSGSSTLEVFSHV
eukprot:6584826-Prymnesium_polylepis.1